MTELVHQKLHSTIVPELAKKRKKELVKVDQFRTKLVNDGAKGHTVPPRTRHVDNTDIGVAFGNQATPGFQCFGAL